MEFTYRRTYCGPVQAVVLDWSGTTVDYGSLAPVAALIEVFRRREVEITPEEARVSMGVHKRTHILELTREPSVAERWHGVHGRQPTDSDVEAMFVDFVPTLCSVLPRHSEPITGALDAVSALRQRGIRIGSSTGYTRAMMDLVAPEAAKHGYAPDSIVCSSDVPDARPAPWMALMSAMELGVYPMAAVVKIGDTVPDILEGLNAGMWTIALAQTGNELGLRRDQVEALTKTDLDARLGRARERLAQAGAHYVANALADTPPIVDEIDKRMARGECP